MRASALLNVLCFLVLLSGVCLAAEQSGQVAKRIADLDRAMQVDRAQYNPQIHMVRTALVSPGYHTTVTQGPVHGTRVALTYAVQCLDTGDEELRKRAQQVLRAVIALQDQNPESRTYGIWPWFYEEPLSKMSPPDWNWADFCGVQLLQAALGHEPRLDADVRQLVKDAVFHACQSIRKRDVGPDYTNIAVMGTYVTLIAGEFYDWADIREYGMQRLKRFYDHTQAVGAFNEYNSPTYTVVALVELSRLQEHVKDAQARKLVEELVLEGWEDVAAHYHAPTGQWAGPHSRSYSTFLGGRTAMFLQQGTGIDLGVDMPRIGLDRNRSQCPPQFRESFGELKAPRDVVKTYSAGKYPVIGTTHLQQAFTLGSVNRGDFWNQRRGVLAYFGTRQDPGALRLRLLRDGYDFSAAQLYTSQHEGDLLAGIVFATNGGNKHLSLDRLKDGEFTASDLRLSFEFSGCGASARLITPDQTGAAAVVALPGVTAQFQVPYARFDDLKPVWQIRKGESGDGKTASLDLVLYQGAERRFQLKQVKEAALAVVLRLTTQPASALPAAEVAADAGQLKLRWSGMRLAVPLQPATQRELQERARLGND